MGNTQAKVNHIFPKRELNFKNTNWMRPPARVSYMVY